MGSTYEDTVLDFDLNFLQQSPNIANDCRIDKQRKAILIAKKKTVATDSLIKKYFAKKEQLEQTEIVLLTAKEECKQVCIDYKESLEKCTQLEKDVQSLQNLNKELQLNCEMTQNQVEAIRSHSHQLQVLVKEHETVIEALKIENQLEKNNVKDYEKNLLNLKKENETLLNDLCLVRDIVLGKKKLNKHHKLVLQKYDKARRKCNVDDSASESSSDETELFDSSPSSPLFSPFGVTTEDKNKESDLKPNENVTCSKKESTRINKDYDSDCSNERVSEDTGRGSSLAFSDGEKCFNSPDYFSNDSPLATECNKIKERRVFVNACTSPMTIFEVVHIATSPLMFDDEALLSDNNTSTPIEKDSNGAEYFITDIPLSSEVVTIKEKKSVVDTGTSTDIKMNNVSTSPILFQELDLVHKKLTHSATSPIQNIQNCSSIITEPDVSALHSCDNAVNNVIGSLPRVEIRHTIIQNLSSQCELEISDKSLEEKRCLERNNSNNIYSENSNDSEIEMILNSMRLTEKLITPIPKTPVKISKKEGKKLISPAKEQLNLPNRHIVCPESLKLREENRVLQTSISDLSKEIINIKCILKKQHLMPETPKKNLSEVNKCQIKNSELFDDSSQEVISIHLNGEKNSDDNNKDYDEINNDCFSNSSINMEISISPPTVENSVNHGPVIQSIEVFPAGSQVRTEISSPTLLELHKSSERKKETNFNSVSLVENRKIIEDNLRIESEVEETLACDSNEEILLNDSKYKNIKHKKLSRLERFRKKLLPKSKIKRINVPIRKLHTKSKVIPLTKSKTTDADLLVNNKSAYEKAIRVMKELKQKKGNDEEQGAINKKIKNIGKDKINSEQKESNNNRNDSVYDSIEKYTSTNKSPVEIKQPVICLSPIRFSNIKYKDKQQKIKVTSPRKSKDTLLSTDSSPTTNIINTRSRTKSIQDSITSIQVNSGTCKYNEPQLEESKEFTNKCTRPVQSKKRLKRAASDNPPVESKRILRSQNVREMFMDQANAEEDYLLTSNSILNTSNSSPHKKRLSEEGNENWNIFNKDTRKSLKFIEGNVNTNIEQNIDVICPIIHPKESILCKMLEKFGKEKIKYSAKKIPDDVSNMICKKLEEDIAKIIELPIDKTKSAMTKLVDEIQHSWKIKKFLSGFMKYLKDPARKRELFNKVTSPPAPPMTKSEQVLLFVVRQLEISSPNTVSMILTHIEFSLFQLNKSPEFDVIESLAHFYALLCRYFGFKNRLRQFLLDAMYCLQFKVVPLIKQCLDVWMHILPLAHMGIAKSPLVTCLVYLLHFYKCEDKFNRIQDIRFILNKKYFYQVTDWNETKILEMFRNSIKELRDIKVEKKMLRMAFIILAKRQGPKWCQKNIVKNMLLPMIEKEDIPMRIRQFSVELLGPLLKPYPSDMKVHCEIVVNQLLDMLEQEIPDSMKEAIFTSLIYMNKHNQNRVTQSLLSWSPKGVSPEFEGLMRDFVREKPLKVWKGILSRTAL